MTDRDRERERVTDRDRDRETERETEIVRERESLFRRKERIQRGVCSRCLSLARGRVLSLGDEVLFAQQRGLRVQFGELAAHRCVPLLERTVPHTRLLHQIRLLRFERLFETWESRTHLRAREREREREAEPRKESTRRVLCTASSSSQSSSSSQERVTLV